MWRGRGSEEGEGSVEGRGSEEGEGRRVGGKRWRKDREEGVDSQITSNCLHHSRFFLQNKATDYRTTCIIGRASPKCGSGGRTLSQYYRPITRCIIPIVYLRTRSYWWKYIDITRVTMQISQTFLLICMF